MTPQVMMELLETRLDNIIFRIGLAPTRHSSRQMVSHGHIMVNGRKVSVPSFLVSVGNKISIRPQSKDHPAFKDLAERLKQYEVPVWLRFDKGKLEGEVAALPKSLETAFNINMVVDYYSK